MRLTRNMKGAQRVIYLLGGLFLIALSYFRDLASAYRVAAFLIGVVAVIQAAVGF